MTKSMVDSVLDGNSRIQNVVEVRTLRVQVSEQLAHQESLWLLHGFANSKSDSLFHSPYRHIVDFYW